AGSTLRTGEGLPIGTLCVLDYVPRRLNALQRRAVEVMAAQVMRQLELRLALGRQDILRREIDHRVKNSLASISAIIELQAARSGNAQVQDALSEVQKRLMALLSLHSELQQGGDESVDLQGLVGRLAVMLGQLLPPTVALRHDIEPAVLAVGDAQSVGIIVNEFVSNAGKHASFNGGTGEVSIRGRRAGDRYLLVCSDDGSGGDQALAAVLSSKGLGTSIIAASARSLRADVDWSADPGLKLRLSIPLGAEL
ncbi:MAG: sensor histidine kinase, partial [Gammaproteobacteria bacterium]